MSDRDNANSSLGTFLKNFSAPILTVISFISSVYGFVKLFADKDSGLITLVVLSVGILLALSICLYYALFWKPEQQDKGRSLFTPSLLDEQVKAQAKKERQRKQVRRLAVAGLILIPIFCGSGIASWKYTQSLPPKDITVLIAEFDGSDSKNFGVTETVINQLRQATEKYSDVKIQALNKSITEQEGSEVARTEGEKRKATIVIWGWYRNTGAVVPLSVHFEVLRPPKALPQLGQTAKGQLQQAALADLKSFTLQPRLSNEMSYLSLFTLGMTRVAAADWDGAIARFSDALSQRVERTTALDQSLVYFQRGYVYLRKGAYDLALTDLAQAIKLQPKLAGAYANRMLIYLNKGDYKRALADVNQAIKLQPNFALAHNNRGIVYVNVGGYDQAIADFSQALKLMPAKADSASTLRSEGRQLDTGLRGDREVPIVNFFFSDELSDYPLYINRGMAYLSKQDYDRALADLSQAIKIEPNRAVAYFNRAGIFYAKENYDLAIADCNQVIKLQPNFALAYVKRGATYFAKKDYELAISDLNQAIKIQPDSDTYMIRGDFYYEKGDYDLAVTDYSQSLKFKPNLSAYIQRGNSYNQKGDYDLAIADYDHALKLKPDDARIYNDRGIVYKNKGDYDRAMADYDLAIKLKPDYMSTYHNRGNVHTKRGDYELAVADFNQAIKLELDSAGNYSERGYTYALKGDYDLALADANKALNLNPNSAGAYDTRGFAFAGKGDYDQAITNYDQALRLIEDTGKTIKDLKKSYTVTYDVPQIYYHRGLAYRKQGKKDRAIADFKKALELTKEPKMRQDAEKQLKELGVK
jgi:tetratricopeptide (TPR) repeat protein